MKTFHSGLRQGLDDRCPIDKRNGIIDLSEDREEEVPNGRDLITAEEHGERGIPILYFSLRTEL